MALVVRMPSSACFNMVISPFDPAELLGTAHMLKSVLADVNSKAIKTLQKHSKRMLGVGYPR